MSKNKNCPRCGAPLNGQLKFCPNCGLKLEQPAYKKSSIWIIIGLVALVLIVYAVMVFVLWPRLNDNDTNNSDNASTPVSEETSNVTSEETTNQTSSDATDQTTSDSSDSTDTVTQSTTSQLDSEFSESISQETELERAIFEVIENNGAVVTVINTAMTPEGDVYVSTEVLIENDEELARKITEDVAALPDLVPLVSLLFEDIELGYFSGEIFRSYVYSDGTYEFNDEYTGVTEDTSTTEDTATSDPERQNWINSQFSVTTGAHIELEELIINSLDDPESYEHIETVYYDTTEEGVLETVNFFFDTYDFDYEAKTGDIFIYVTLATTNSNGEQIVTFAYGLATYPEDELFLIEVE